MERHSDRAHNMISLIGQIAYGVAFGLLSQLYVRVFFDQNEHLRTIFSFWWIGCTGICAVAALYAFYTPTFRKRWNTVILFFAVGTALSGRFIEYSGWYLEGYTRLIDGFGVTLLYQFLLFPISCLLILGAVFSLNIHAKWLWMMGVLVGLFLWGVALETLFPHQPGAVVFMRGFQARIQKSVTADQLHIWGSHFLTPQGKEKVLAQSEEGQFTDSQIPEMIQNVWVTPPHSVSLWEWEGEQGTEESIHIAWYSHGIVVGSSRFQASWEPFYSDEWIPGVYFYFIEGK